MALGFTHPVTEMNTKNLPAGVKGGGRLGLASPPSVRGLSRNCKSLDASQRNWPRLSVTGIATSHDRLSKSPGRRHRVFRFNFLPTSSGFLCFIYSSSLEMEVMNTSETSDRLRTTRVYNPDDRTPQDLRSTMFTSVP
jgi:hypothetical protein